MQIDKAPYAYPWNNPIRYDDPDGRCPWCVGALVGSALDLAFQTVVEGKSLSKVNYGSVALSAGAGAVGAGLIAKAGKVFKAGKALRATEAGIDAGVNITQQVIEGEEIDLRETATSVVLGQTVRSPIRDKVKSANTGVNQAKEELKNAQGNLTKVENRLRTGISTSKANKKLEGPRQKVDVKQKQLRQAQRGAVIDATAAGAVSSSVPSKVFNKFVPQTTTSIPLRHKEE